MSKKTIVELGPDEFAVVIRRAANDREMLAINLEHGPPALTSVTFVAAQCLMHYVDSQFFLGYVRAVYELAKRQAGLVED